MLVSLFLTSHHYHTMEPKLNKTVNSEVGANKRLRRSDAVDPRIQGLIDHVQEHGYVIIEGAFTAEEVREAKDEVKRLSSLPTVAQASSGKAKGRNTFEGLRTQRIYGLAGKSRVFDKFALHPDILAINDYFLDPGYLLNSFQSINIQPGEEPQTLHYDDGYITIKRPHAPFGGVRRLPFVRSAKNGTNNPPGHHGCPRLVHAK
jgi:hypothetical protein